ncbi:MAG: hypothetical protein AVDCRST_MAG35-988, partial [uncultured Quadrisphaera sp.]
DPRAAEQDRRQADLHRRPDRARRAGLGGRHLQRLEPGHPRAAQAQQRHPQRRRHRARRSRGALPLPGQRRPLVRRPGRRRAQRGRRRHPPL